MRHDHRHRGATLTDGERPRDEPTLAQSDELSRTAPYERGPAASTDEELPLANWTRYRIEHALGEGGMGQVYKAYDPRLRRSVALKFMRGNDPAFVERFQSEARAQARVDHDRICKIFEVGEVEGRPFIAMQLVDGEPLGSAARNMTLEQRLIVMRQVAEGLHEAHRAGLVHRDIKPSNIMVERASDGEWRPFIMDFGLARRSEHADLTIPGAVLGTPHYMAPEQARGKTDEVDRRTDVYSLGATLYSIVAGRPPFEGTTFAELLPQIINKVPTHLLRLNRSIPSDVDAIAQRALRKEPANRYGSAREFAADIGRYLDGEPIHARPTTWMYRARLKAARNRPLVGLGIGAACALLVAVGWGIHTQRQGAERSRIAEEFGRDVERIDAVARYTAMAPPHDVRPARERIRSQMREIETHMDEVGDLAAPSGHYALGRGYLALGDYRAALNSLERSRDLGHDTPDLAYALGLALSELYRREMSALRSLSDRRERQRLQARADSLYRAPARQALVRAASGGVLDSPDFVHALIRYHDGELSAALERAQVAAEAQSWFYEARRLEGDVHAEMMTTAADSGDVENTDRHFNEALDAYTVARMIAPSDLPTYQSTASLAGRRVSTEQNVGGGDIGDLVDIGFETIYVGLIVAPGDPTLLVTKSELLLDLAEQEARAGTDPDSLLDLAIHAAREAIETDAEFEPAYRRLGETFHSKAKHEHATGEDPSANFRAAIDAFEHAATLSPKGATYYDQIGLVYKSLALSLLDRGKDATEELAQSIDAYRRGLEIDDSRYALHHNLAVAYYTQAKHTPDDRAALEILDSADAAFQAAASTQPMSLAIHYNAGRARAFRASIEYDAGLDAIDATTEAVAAFQRAIAVNPSSSYAAIVWDAVGSAYFDRATASEVDATSADAAYDSSVASYQRALSIMPDYQFALSNLGGLYVRRAATRTTNDDLRADCDTALSLLRRAIDKNPKYALAYVNVATAHRLLAEARLVAAETALAAARDTLEVALECNPKLYSTYLEYGRVARGWAEAAVHAVEDPMPHLETAIAKFAHAMELKPGSNEAHLGWAESLIRRAEISTQRAQDRFALDAAHDAVNRARLEMADPSELFDLSKRLDRLIEKSAEGR